MANGSLKTNRRVLRGLLVIQNRAIDLEFQLRSDGKTNEADKIGLGIDKLDFLIRVLRGKVLDDWSAQFPDLRKKLNKMNAEAQDAINDIEDDIEIANRVVSLVAKVDKLVSLLGPLLL